MVQRRSRKFATRLDIEFERGIGKLIPSRGIKKADFSVLRGSLMPAVLIEMGYLSHPKEAIFLESKKSWNLRCYHLSKMVISTLPTTILNLSLVLSNFGFDIIRNAYGWLSPTLFNTTCLFPIVLVVNIC